jgi:hypothetical protein
MLKILKNFNWTKNMFLVPIFLVAGISISHVVSWYNMANPINWAIYLSIAIEIGAMTSLMAATKKIKGGVWFMFGLVTFIQMVGNIFYSYVHIDETGELFRNWIELTSPIFESMGTDPGDIIPHKRWLALLEGGFLPLISLTALHFYIKYDDSGDTSTPASTPTGTPEGPSDDVEGLPMDSLIGDEPKKEEPIIEIPDGIGPNSEYNKIMGEQWKKHLEEKEEKTYWDENPDRELGKYDMKFGPEYTKMIDEVEAEMEKEVEPIVEEVVEEVVEEPIIKEEPKGIREISDDESERQKHLKFRKRLVEDENGKKTLIYPKRDKITQKIVK